MPIMNNGGSPIRPNYLNTTPAKAGFGDPTGPSTMLTPQQGAVAQRLDPQINRAPAVAGFGDPLPMGPRTA
jgi:hypothetical protein